MIQVKEKDVRLEIKKQYSLFEMWIMLLFYDFEDYDIDLEIDMFKSEFYFRVVQYCQL